MQVASSEADTARGGVQPSGEVDPARGSAEASSEADPAEGAHSPRARRTLLEGRSVVPPWLATGATRAVIMLCAYFRCVG
jgi:hypothetical protein